MRSVFTSLAAMTLAASAQAAVIYGDAADLVTIRANNTNQIVSGTVDAANLLGGHRNTDPAGRLRPVVVFQLPELGSVADPFTSATLELHLASKQGSFTFNLDLYGLNTTSTSPTVLASYADDTGGTASTLLHDNMFVPATAVGTVSSGNAALVNFLNARYAGGANAGSYVFLRLFPDAPPTGTGDLGFNISSANTGDTAGMVGDGVSYDPKITFTAVPEPTLLAPAALLAGLVLRRRR